MKNFTKKKFTIICAAIMALQIASVNAQDYSFPELLQVPAIDGELDGVYSQALELIPSVIDSEGAATPDDEADFSITMKIGWNDDNIFMYIDIKDDIEEYGSGAWNSDGMDFFFDGDNSKGTERDGTDDMQWKIVRNYEYPNLALSYGPDITGWDFDASTVDYVIQSNDDGYILEVSLSITELQLDTEGFGFDMQFNDNDDGNRNHMIRVAHENDADWTNPSTWATVNLESAEVSAISDIEASDLALTNYPNPFNNSTNINYEIASTGLVTIEIYNISGSKVATILQNEYKTAGSYSIPFVANNLKTGIYFCNLKCKNQVAIKKMIILE